MEASIAGAVVGATVQVGLQNVLLKMLEINIGWGYTYELTRLKDSLIMVQNHLSDAEGIQVRGGVKWLRQLEDAAFDADAVLGEVKYHLLGLQVENKIQDCNSVWDYLFPATNKFNFKINMSSKIKAVTEKMEKINKDANGLGLQTAIAFAGQMNTTTILTPTERETDSFSVEPKVVGRDEDVSKIVEILTSPCEKKISVLPIVGMGGVGKTTLARKVFHHKKIGDHFGERIWVCVSFNFDSLSIFKKILGALTQDEANGTREVVLQNIKNHFADKRYLLVLDDIWNENYSRWGEFNNTLLNISGVEGNCIVVTTRKENVASQVGTYPTHQLGGLTDRLWWSIIKAETSGETDVPEDFESIWKDIAIKCGGLPLAAKVMGGLLRGKSKEYWRSISKNKLFDSDDDKIMKILRLSYDNLPTSSLKKCFAYCSVFRRVTAPIKRQVLVELWMAEGFLQVGQGDDMETAGAEVLQRLLQYSLFQDAEKDIFGHIVHVKMHDLVLDLACSITADMHQVRYLALKSGDANDPNKDSQGQKMKSLRTMFFEGKIAEIKFSDLRCLYVLKLKDSIKELPSKIEELINLRSLDISSTEVECLPDSIGKLYHLQSLSTAHNLKRLPDTIINLVGLRHLHISEKAELPPGIGNLASLRTLKHYKVRAENGCRIGELGSLKNLKGELKIENLEMVKDTKEAELADLYGKTDIFKFTLRWNGSSDGVGHHKNVLDGLQPHPHLKSLEIIGYKGEKLPSWTMEMSAPARNNTKWEAYNKLVEIRFESFTQCEELPMLGHVPCLKHLVLSTLHSVRSLGFSFYGPENFKIAFPALEKLELFDLQGLTECPDMEAETTVFARLITLKISRCPNLKTFHSHFPCLEKIEVNVAHFSLTNLLSNTSTLANMKINGTTANDFLPNELFTENKNLTHLEITDCRNFMGLVRNSLGGGASLKKLFIWGCYDLSKLPDDLNTLCKLEELRIQNCPGLKCIPYNASGKTTGFTSLRELHINECRGLTGLPNELLESCKSSLAVLSLQNLENLENLDRLIPCIGRMSCLKSLTALRIPKFTINPTGIGCLMSLLTLNIGGFSEPMTVDQLTTIIRKFPSLIYLGLVGMDSFLYPNLEITYYS